MFSFHIRQITCGIVESFSFLLHNNDWNESRGYWNRHHKPFTHFQTAFKPSNLDLAHG